MLDKYTLKVLLEVADVKRRTYYNNVDKEIVNEEESTLNNLCLKSIRSINTMVLEELEVNLKGITTSILVV